jgi:flagellar basal-body rod protein FlgG
MLAESLRTDVTANNLANVNTAGYKKDITVTKDFQSMLLRRINDGATSPEIGGLGAGVMVDQVYTDQSTGVMRATGNPLDLAIDGKGFFTVQTPNGVRYTRNGSFSRNARGEIVTLDGNRVLGTNGPITLPDAKKVSVSPDGRVFADGVEAGRLRLASFNDERQLIKEGSSLYAAGAGAQEQRTNAEIREGSLEMSNANVVGEMVNLISGYRAYEVNAKTVQSQDELLDKAVNEVGKV